MQRRRGTFWQRPEIEALLDVVLHCGQVADLMASTPMGTRSIYERVSKRLARRGFSRTADQCRSKFKRLKLDFMGSLEAWRGAPLESGRCAFHGKMMELWEAAGRPRWEDRRHLSTNPPCLVAQAAGAAKEPVRLAQDTPEEEQGEDPGQQTPLKREEEEAPISSTSTAIQEPTAHGAATATAAAISRMQQTMDNMLSKMTAVGRQMRNFNSRIGLIEQRQRRQRTDIAVLKRQMADVQRDLSGESLGVGEESGWWGEEGESGEEGSAVEGED